MFNNKSFQKMEKEYLENDDILLGLEEELEEEMDQDLEGLARRLSFSPKVRSAVRRWGAKQRKAGMISRGRTKGQNLLKAKANQFDATTQASLRSGTLEYHDGEFYVRKDISLAAGVKRLFDDSLDMDEGVTNISKAKLDSNVNLMLERIEINFDRGTGITTKTADLIPLASTDDNALLNGEIEITVDGKTIVKVPVNSFVHPPKNESAVTANCNGFNLSAPKLIKSGQKIQVNLYLAGTMATSTDKDVIEVKMRGAATRVAA